MDEKKKLCTCGKSKNPPYCDGSHEHTDQMDSISPKKIVLAHLPYWSPLIPPMGIAALKGFLEKHSFRVKNYDLNTEHEFKEIYNRYFEILKKNIPESKWGNFYNIGHDVLQNHMMAHFNHYDEEKYSELVKILIYKSYYINVDDNAANELNRILADLFSALERYFLKVIQGEKTDVFGLTAYKGTLPACVFTFKFIKERYPHIKTVMGGGVFADSHTPGSPNFETLLEKTKDYLDKIIIGQGELLFLKYLQGQLPENQRVYTKKDLDGKILDFPSVDIPDFSDFDIHKYPYLVATHSSGCLYECSFCNSVQFWGKYRKKDPAQTASEMIKMYKKHGQQLFFMTDALLNPGVSELAKEFMKSGVSIYYDAYFKVEDAACSLDNTLFWRRGGLYRVRLGVESGSQKVLDLMNKEITVDLIKGTVSALAQAGIKTTTYWVIGHPGETEEDFQKTLDLLEELQSDIFQAECNPFLCHFSGQAASDHWEKIRVSLYPDSMDDMLVFKSWTLNCEPSREDAYDRMHRFVNRCKELNIPNPYSFNEHFNADERWKKLHKNAVPALLEFENPGSYIDENKQAKKLRFSKNLREDSQNFGFEL